jgi:hypothetical protein
MTVELGCAGFWHAFARVCVDGLWTDCVYKVERMADGLWTVKATFPRIDVETERFGGFPTLRDALTACDRDRRLPYDTAA